MELIKGKRVFSDTELGMPQGSIISPLLSNLVLHELDILLQKKMDQLNQKNIGIKPHIDNPMYRKLSSRIINLKRK